MLLERAAWWLAAIILTLPFVFLFVGAVQTGSSDQIALHAVLLVGSVLLMLAAHPEGES